MQRKCEDEDEAAYVDSFFRTGSGERSPYCYAPPVRRSLSQDESGGGGNENVSDGRTTRTVSSNDMTAGDEVQYFLPGGILDDLDDDDDGEVGSGSERRTPPSALSSTLPAVSHEIDGGVGTKVEGITGDFLVDNSQTVMGREGALPTPQISSEVIAGHLKRCEQKLEVENNESIEDSSSSSTGLPPVLSVQQLQGRRRSSSRILNPSQSGLTNNTIDFISELSMSSLGRSSFTDQPSESTTDQVSESITESMSLRSEFDAKVSDNTTGPTRATAGDTSKLERAFGRKDMVWNSQNKGKISRAASLGGVENTTTADFSNDRVQKQSTTRTSTTLSKTNDFDDTDGETDLCLENQQTAGREFTSAEATAQTPSFSSFLKESPSTAQVRHSFARAAAAAAAIVETDLEYRGKPSLRTETSASKKPKRPREKNQGQNAKVKFAQPSGARDEEAFDKENTTHLFWLWNENIYEPLSHLFRFVAEVYGIFSPFVQQVFLLAGSVSIFCTKVLIVVLWGAFRLIQYSTTGAICQADGAILCYLVLYATPFACDALMMHSLVTLPHFIPHILSNSALFCICSPARKLQPKKPSAASGVETNQVGEELCQQILQMIRTCIPISFVLEGFSQPSSNLMMLDPSTRLIFAYVIILLRNGQILSPMAWVGWALQVLILTWIPAGKFLVSLLFILGLGSVRLVTDLEARTSHRSRANTSEIR